MTARKACLRMRSQNKGTVVEQESLPLLAVFRKKARLLTSKPCLSWQCGSAKRFTEGRAVGPVTLLRELGLQLHVPGADRPELLVARRQPHLS